MPHFNPNSVTVKQQLHPPLHLQLQALQRLTQLFGHVTVTGGVHLANIYMLNISNSTYILLHCYKIVISSSKYMSSSNLQHVTAHVTAV
jgi:hypothetical protein